MGKNLNLGSPDAATDAARFPIAGATRNKAATTRFYEGVNATARFWSGLHTACRDTHNATGYRKNPMDGP